MQDISLHVYIQPLHVCVMLSFIFLWYSLFYFWYSQKEVGKSNTEALSEDSKVTQNIITAVIFTCIQLHNLHAINKLILLFSKSALNWSKVRVLIMLQKICTSNKCCSFELSINQIILGKTVSPKILSSTTNCWLLSTLIIIRNAY